MIDWLVIEFLKSLSYQLYSSDDLCRGRQLATPAEIENYMESDKDEKRRRFTTSFLVDEYEPASKRPKTSRERETFETGEISMLDRSKQSNYMRVT